MIHKSIEIFIYLYNKKGGWIMVDSLEKHIYSRAGPVKPPEELTVGGEKPTTHKLQKQACNPLLLHPDKVEHTDI